MTADLKRLGFDLTIYSCNEVLAVAEDRLPVVDGLATEPFAGSPERAPCLA